MSQQAKSQKKNFLKSFFNGSSSKKNSSTVSPQEWIPSTPSFEALDLTQRTITNRRSNEEVYHSQHQSSMVRSSSMQRRYSFSNVHESGQRRLLAAKRAEYQEKMQAFDDLIQRRR